MTTQQLYSCDDVFELLTRGPLGNDTLDQESTSSLQRHLLSCHECRGLAEALRPATQCIHEALADEERVGLPQFMSTLPLVVQRVETPQSTGWRRQLLMATVASLFLFSGAAAWFGQSGTPDAVYHPQMLGSVECLTSLQLASVCQGESVTEPVGAKCCTSCHQATSHTTIAKLDMQRLLTSCTACHQQTAQLGVPTYSQQACNDCHQRG